MRSRRTLVVLTFVALQGAGVVSLVEGQFRKGFTQGTTEVVLQSPPAAGFPDPGPGDQGRGRNPGRP